MSSPSTQYPPEKCPHCNGAKNEPDLTFEMRCTFCKGDGVVSVFKRASYFLEHPDPDKRQAP